MKLLIKNMVCDRCISVVKRELQQLGFAQASVSLGEADLHREPDAAEKAAILNALSAQGFELIDDKKNAIVEKIKTIIIARIHHSSERPKVNYSTLIASETGKDYNYLSNLFSEMEGVTIEHFIILQKIEKVKELLAYDELSLSQIAHELGYSSVAHLSAQFKKFAGQTPSQFKALKSKRQTIDKVKSVNDIKHFQKDVTKKH